MTRRTSLFTLLLMAPVAWGALLLFTWFVRPQTTLALVVFFLLLLAALSSTITLLAYLIGRWLISPRIYRATLRHALRQGLLVSLAALLNLLLLALHSWNIITAIGIVGAAIVIEVLSLARK